MKVDTTLRMLRRITKRLLDTHEPHTPNPALLKANISRLSSFLLKNCSEGANQMQDSHPSTVLFALVVAHTKGWTLLPTTPALEACSDPWVEVVRHNSYGATKEAQNRLLAEKFGVIETKVKAFDSSNGWVVIDASTKRCLANRVPASELDALCRKNNWIR